MMNEKMVELLDARIDRANSHWQFCHALCLMVIGWAGTQGANTNLIFKSSMCIGVMVALFFNLLAILRAQEEMIAISHDIHDVKDQVQPAEQSFYEKLLQERDFSWYPKVTIAIHILLSLLTFAVVIRGS